MILDYSQNGFCIVFEIANSGCVALRHFSIQEKEYTQKTEKQVCGSNIVDVHIAGEDVDDHHGYKHSVSSRSNTLKYVTHRYFKNEFGNKLEFDLADDTLVVTVHYQFYNGVTALRCWSVLTNIGDNNLGLEYVTSFAYLGFDDGDKHPNDKINVYIPRNSWSKECNWKKFTLSQAGINVTQNLLFDRVNIYNTGFWSTKEYLPMGAVENTERKSLYLWQIENNGSWQWEISEKSREKKNEKKN